MFTRLMFILVLLLVIFPAVTAQEVEGYFLPLTEVELAEFDLENSAEPYNAWFYEDPYQEARFYQTSWLTKEISNGRIIVTYFLWRDRLGNLNSSEGYVDWYRPMTNMYPITVEILPDGYARFLSIYMTNLAVQVIVNMESGEIVEVFQFELNGEALNHGLVLEAERGGWPSYLNLVLASNLPLEAQGFYISEWMCLMHGNPATPNGCNFAVQGISYILNGETLTQMSFIVATESGNWVYSQPMLLEGNYFYYNPIVEWVSEDQFLITSCTLNNVGQVFFIEVGGVVTKETTPVEQCDPIENLDPFPWR